MSLLTWQHDHVVITALNNAERMRDEERKASVSQNGAALPLAMAHSEGGVGKGSKSSGVVQFIDSYCGDAMQPSPFYEPESQAVGLPTE